MTRGDRIAAAISLCALKDVLSVLSAASELSARRLGKACAPDDPQKGPQRQQNGKEGAAFAGDIIEPERAAPERFQQDEKYEHEGSDAEQPQPSKSGTDYHAATPLMLIDSSGLEHCDPSWPSALARAVFAAGMYRKSVAGDIPRRQHRDW
jgi:hypothetical protein